MKTEIISNAAKFVTRKVGRYGLVLRKASPEILIVAGIGGVVVGTVLACKATLKVEEIVDETQATLDRINQFHESDRSDYTENDYRKDLAITYIKSAGSFAKIYAPAVVVGVGSIACIVGSHHIMTKRNVALMAAYKAVKESYDIYRKRVIDDVGKDKDAFYRLGIEKLSDKENESEDAFEKAEENGDSIVVREATAKDIVSVSQYARFFDEGSRYYSNTPEYNLLFLKGKQNYFNDLLHARGYVFLNEVYDELGIPRSQAGQVVGWLSNIDRDTRAKQYGNSDGYIDFGIFNIRDDAHRDFVNGKESAILLDFNVDGVIYDMI